MADAAEEAQFELDVGDAEETEVELQQPEEQKDVPRGTKRLLKKGKSRIKGHLWPSNKKTKPKESHVAKNFIKNFKPTVSYMV